MSLPFARSLRSLESDSYQAAMIGLLLVSPLFLGWLIWFFMGEVALHQASTQIAPTDDGLIAVTFADGLPPLEAGIDARLRLEGVEGNPDQVILGYVHRFVPQLDGSMIAHIVLDENQPTEDETLVGEAAIEIESVSPAEFLWDMVDGE